jgi:hypothetical protein
VSGGKVREAVALARRGAPPHSCRNDRPGGAPDPGENRAARRNGAFLAVQSCSNFHCKPMIANTLGPAGSPADRSRRWKHRARNAWRRVTAPLRPLPEFLVIGAQKSGTSSLYHYLAQHPGIAMSRVKETHYFDLHHQRGERWDRSHFPLRPGARVGENSPYYLAHPRAAERIRAALPGARLIALLRNPTERALSHYFHEVRKGRESLPIADALAGEEARTAGEWERLRHDDTYHSPVHRAFSYKQRSRYAEQLGPYLERFERSQLLVLQSEDLFAEPAATLARICAFLDVEPLAGTANWSAHNVGTRHGDVPGAVRAYLDDYFAPHNERLCALLDQPFGWTATGPEPDREHAAAQQDRPRRDPLAR